MLAWLYFLLLLITDICGLVLAAITLPGLWLMLAGAAVYALLTHGRYLGWHMLIALFLLALTAEIGEIVIGGAGAKKAGASGWGIAGGLIGAIIGGIVLSTMLPPLGTIIGICLGSFAGAFAVEFILGQPLTQSAKLGFGAAKGRLTGIVGKVAIGVLMLLLTIIAGIPIQCTRAAPMATTKPATMSATTQAK